MELEYRLQAEIDILEAWTYYESQQNGLGQRFLDILDDTIQRVRTAPQHYSFIDASGTRRDTALDIFPYVVIFEIVADTIVIFRVFNTYQDPNSL